MSAPADSPRIAAAFLRTGGFLADALFLAHILALCGMLLWFLDKSDLAGFALIGGSVAGLLSVFRVQFVWRGVLVLGRRRILEEFSSA